MSELDSYYKTVAYLESLNKAFVRVKNPEMYIERTRYFLELIGRPDKGLKFIHITGTAGKGTVSAMIQSALTGSGVRTGLFTSPYVQALTELIKVDNLYIDQKELVGIVDYLRPFIAVAGKSAWGAPSYFELIVIISFEYFKRQKCEWAVVEVGMGGKYDATNVIENSIVTAVTNVHLDHEVVLGKTVEEIAKDKAGIIKNGSYFFTSELRPHILEMFENICKENGAVFSSVGDPSNSFSENNYAIVNAIAKNLGISDNVMENSAGTTKLPARFEIVKNHPLVVIDGAHNPVKIESVVQKVDGLKKNKVIIVLAISDDKDYKGMLDRIMKVADVLFVTGYKSNVRACRDPEELFMYTQNAGFKKKCSIEKDPFKAFSDACATASENDIVVVTGSFYLAGMIRGLFFTEENVLTKRISF